MNLTHRKILDVALGVYAERGYRGATTRRIAEAAGVNEVTLYRHFGTKDALIRAAIEAAEARARTRLDYETPDPDAELRRWVRLAFARFYGARNLICQVMADMVQYPDMAPRICATTDEEFIQLDGFIARLVERGILPAFEAQPRRSMSWLLLGGIFTHAMWRDVLPDVPPVEDVLEGYVDAFWRAARAPWAASQRTG